MEPVALYVTLDFVLFAWHVDILKMSFALHCVFCLIFELVLQIQREKLIYIPANEKSNSAKPKY